MQQVLLILSGSFTCPLGPNKHFAQTQILPSADVKIETEDLTRVHLDPQIIGEGVALITVWERAVLCLI